MLETNHGTTCNTNCDEDSCLWHVTSLHAMHANVRSSTMLELEANVLLLPMRVCCDGHKKVWLFIELATHHGLRSSSNQ